MSCPPDGPTSLASAASGNARASDLCAIEHAFDSILSELTVISGSRERVDEACAVVRAAPWAWPLPSIAGRLEQVASVARRAPRALTPILLSLLFDVADSRADPWPVLSHLVSCTDPAVGAAALDRVGQSFDAGRLPRDGGTFDLLARVVDAGPPHVQQRAFLAHLGQVLHASGCDDAAALEARCAASPHVASRRLAARLLDLSPDLPSRRTAAALLGGPLAEWLWPYLAYTRATHADLVDLASGSAGPVRLLRDLRAVEAETGAPLLQHVVGEVGWKALNSGLVVTRLALVSVGESFPLVLRPAEASLLDGCPGVRCVGERLVLLARGAEPGDGDTARSDSSIVDRFRATNLRHADVLADLMDIAPLTTDKVARMLDRMDAIVSDFCTLFAAHTDECATILARFGQLRDDIQRELVHAAPGHPLPAALTRLVQMFEDPQSAADIHTLHGCKRYLHQRGLRLGFRLAEAGRSTNRTVTLAVCDAERVLLVERGIEYVDFEPESDPARLPHLVQIAVDAVTRHMLHGESSFPKLKFFCYGNEVHCFATFRNHPAFIRVDFSPPQRGGMIDLEYCGVSKFDLEYHPNVALTGIEAIFRRFEFDVQVTDTRVRARYDKERASNLRQLSEKVEGLFRLVPALMDVDWVIGDLQLSPAARAEVTDAWADFFLQWGIVPLRHVLTADRVGILAGIQPDPAGDREIRWTGAEPYHDRFTVPVPQGFWNALRARLAEQPIQQLLVGPGDAPVTQRGLESILLEPLRRAAARGEVLEGPRGYASVPPTLYRPAHEARLLAEVLVSSDDTVAASARLAQLATMVEGVLRFDVTGTINGYEVQRAVLFLPGETFAICVLRDGSGIIRAALLVSDDMAYERRETESDPWRRNWSVQPAALSLVMRRSNYAPPWTDSPAEPDSVVAERVRAAVARRNIHARPAPLPGERLAAGLKASPGRAVGTARIGLAGRRPQDLDGCIIVESALSPSDNPFVFRAAGIVTTGGGILSHAGLLALQFHKPALVVAGRFDLRAPGARSLVCTGMTRREVSRLVGPYAVVEQHDISAHDDRVDDGDVVVVDADAGTLLVLGQQPDTLALHEDLQRLAASARNLASARSDPELLVQRGTMLRARHQLERLFTRVQDPVLARHAATELLVGEAGRDPAVHPGDKARLLTALCQNAKVGNTARDAVLDLHERIRHRLVTASEAAARQIQSSRDPVEVLALRLDVLRTAQLLDNMPVLFEGFTVLAPGDHRTGIDAIDEQARRRLVELRAEALAVLSAAGLPGGPQALRQVERIDQVLGAVDPAAAEFGERFAAEHAEALGRAARARVVRATDGGAELWPLVGAKAANLAEATRLGEGALIPPWFVVTDRAFHEALECRVPGDPGGATVAAAIERALGVRDWSNAQKAAAIGRAWDAIELPGDLVADLAAAYRQLAAADVPGAPPGDVHEDPAQPFVAVRSSAREEDAEASTRAGEFDTFLFVRGDAPLRQYLKRAWSGLWNERAIHNRAMLGLTGPVGGGMLVQRMVWARVSGVLHTINLAGGQWREMVINAGLGLGEGIVSGAVAADQVIVSKDAALLTASLNFRYITNDKRECVLFDRGSGSGTRLVETLYHQRLRPALEYVELCDLVHAAARLEARFRQPLDIEFAIAGPHLYILQVRPIPAAYATWRDTIERYPLARRPA